MRKTLLLLAAFSLIVSTQLFAQGESKAEPLIILDNYVLPNIPEWGSLIEPKDIEAVTVQKADIPENLGKRAQNGVIRIETKEQNLQGLKFVVEKHSAFIEANPLYTIVLDGIIITNQIDLVRTLFQLKKNQIKSTERLTPETTKEKYPSITEGGVIIIKTTNQ